MCAIKSLEIDIVSTIVCQFTLLLDSFIETKLVHAILSSYFYSDAQLVPIVTIVFSLNIQVKLNYFSCRCKTFTFRERVIFSFFGYKAEIYILSFYFREKKRFLKKVFFSKIVSLNNTLYSQKWTTRCVRPHYTLPHHRYKSVYLAVNVIKSDIADRVKLISLVETFRFLVI